MVATKEECDGIMGAGYKNEEMHHVWNMEWIGIWPAFMVLTGSIGLEEGIGGEMFTRPQWKGGVRSWICSSGEHGHDGLNVCLYCNYLLF